MLVDKVLLQMILLDDLIKASQFFLQTPQVGLQFLTVGFLPGKPFDFLFQLADFGFLELQQLLLCEFVDLGFGFGLGLGLDWRSEQRLVRIEREESVFHLLLLLVNVDLFLLGRWLVFLWLTSWLRSPLDLIFLPIILHIDVVLDILFPGSHAVATWMLVLVCVQVGVVEAVQGVELFRAYLHFLCDPSLLRDLGQCRLGFLTGLAWSALLASFPLPLTGRLLLIDLESNEIENPGLLLLPLHDSLPVPLLQMLVDGAARQNLFTAWTFVFILGLILSLQFLNTLAFV